MSLLLSLQTPPPAPPAIPGGSGRHAPRRLRASSGQGFGYLPDDTAQRQAQARRRRRAQDDFLTLHLLTH